MPKRKPKKTKPKQPRNWIAVDARTRHTAGPMRDNKKDESKRKCRKKVKDAGGD